MVNAIEKQRAVPELDVWAVGESGLYLGISNRHGRGAPRPADDQVVRVVSAESRR